MLYFPSHGGSSRLKRERYSSKVWVCLRCTTKAVGDLKHRVGMLTTHRWELSELGGDVLGALGQRVSTR